MSSLTRDLFYYWRTHLAVLLGAAVATAVLTGALVVGDSVQGSLRELTLERLGRVDAALVVDRLFRAELADELEAELATELPGTEGEAARQVVGILLAQASAVAEESGARASRVSVLGVEADFETLFPGSDPSGPDPSGPDPSGSVEARLDFARREGQVFPSVILNQSLAHELRAEVGDAVLLSFRGYSAIPEETLVGRTDAEDAVEQLRLTVVAVLPEHGPDQGPDHGLGGFSLLAQQSQPRNAFVERGRLSRTLAGRARDRVNALLVAAGSSDPPAVEAARLTATLSGLLTAEDLGLKVQPAVPAAGRETPSEWGTVVVESEQLVLTPEISDAVLAAAEELGATAVPVLTYLANEIRAAEGAVPYSTVAALPFDQLAAESFVPIPGSPESLTEDDLLLNRWAAEDLWGESWAEHLGEPLELAYFHVGARDELTEKEIRLRFAGVVEMRGLGADPSLTPEFPGMSDADNMADWDPPFPVDLERIRPRDEEYWDLHRAAPKAFVSLELGQRLWNTRFGDLSSIRLTLPPAAGDAADEDEAGALAERLAAELPRRLGAAGQGFTFRAVKAEALAASAGATDFSQLFLAFSFFLITSSALLVGLLFRLGVEARAREIGLLLATGFRTGWVRRRFLLEGGVLAALGALLGLGGAIAYAAAMLHGLRTWWQGAVGTPRLFLHVQPSSLAVGWGISVLVVLTSIVLALRMLRRVPLPSLLAGSVSETRGGVAGGDLSEAGARQPSGWKRLTTLLRPSAAQVALSFGILAALLLAATLASELAGQGGASSPALAFATGTCLLIAGLALLAHWCRRGPRAGSAEGGSGAVLTGGLFAMGSRNSARNPGRSILSAALVAVASFMIVAVGANRGHGDFDVTDPAGPTGGFPLMAESDVPITQDLTSPSAREALGFSPRASSALEGVDILPFRLLPGEDASCLNLYRPQEPRVLGVPRELIERGGFTFQALAEEVAEPWTLLSSKPGSSPDDGAAIIPAFADANSAQWILKVGLGEDIALTDGRGQPVRLRLVGLFAKGLFQSELLISEEAFVRHFPERTGSSFFLIRPRQETLGVEEIASTLEAALGDFGFDVSSTAERLAAFAAVESTYMATFQTLGGLGLLLGTIGLGIILLRNVLERRKELATLRAFGFRRRRLGALVVAENVFLLLVGLGIGTVSALAAVTPRLLTAAGDLPWLSLTITLVLVFLVGLAASVAAVIGAGRVPLLPALKSE